jgi:hypothetical protein
MEESFKYPKSNVWCPSEYFKESSGIITGQVEKAIIESGQII